ncbi:retrotransposon protein, putative, ty1-copia subclass [Tanacetum coccineum]
MILPPCWRYGREGSRRTRNRKGQKGKGKGKNKLAHAPKPKISPPPKRDNLKKDSICHHYKEVGHWRRNCPSYHAELKKRKNASVTSTLGIFTIELYAFPNKTWVYDMGCGTRICNTSEGLIKTRKLKHGALSLYIGNGMRVAIEAIRSFDLILPSGLIIVLDNHTEIAPTEAESHNDGVPIHRSARTPQVPNRYGYYVDIEEYELGDLNEPPNYKAAFANHEFNKWLEAMNTKMQSMKDNQVWYLVDLPSNGRTVRCKWLFKQKTGMGGNVHTFKARLVAKGFTQTFGVDYGETFSLVADIKPIRILLAIATFYDYEIWKMDVKIAFLNGHLSEDIYMVQTKGFVDPNHPNKVCKLQCSIYGLKQASRSWNKMFDEEIKKIGFTQNLKANGSNVAFLVLYVDDILLMGNSVTMLQEVKSWLCKCFSMIDLGEAAYNLGIKIIRDRSKRLITLS